MNLDKLQNHGYLKLIELTLEDNEYSIDTACKVTGLNHKQFNFIKHNLFVLNAAQDANQGPDIVQQWELSPNSYFNYLQYLEFKHSVESSHKSFRLAVIAILTSVILAVVSLIFSINTSPTYNKVLNTDSEKIAASVS